jgi:hypothetical protein
MAGIGLEERKLRIEADHIAQQLDRNNGFHEQEADCYRGDNEGCCNRKPCLVGICPATVGLSFHAITPWPITSRSPPQVKLTSVNTRYQRYLIVAVYSRRSTARYATESGWSGWNPWYPRLTLYPLFAFAIKDILRLLI